MNGPGAGRLPRCTALVCALAALVHAWPGLAERLIFDRQAILGGQWWRVLSGSLVHLSAAHFTWDVLALALIGGLAEGRGGARLGGVYLGAMLAVGAAVLVGAPQLRWYGGLSGVVTAALVWLLLDVQRSAGALRWAARAGLLLVAVKLEWELGGATSWLVAQGGQPFVAVPASHLAGALAGLAGWAVGTGRAVQALQRPGRRRCPIATEIAQ